MDVHAYVPDDDLKRILQNAKGTNQNKKHHFKIESTIDTLAKGVKECVSRFGIMLSL